MQQQPTKEERLWQSVLIPSYENEYKHWGKKIVVCILISGLLFTYWKLYA